MKVKKPGSMLGWGLVLALAANLVLGVSYASAAAPMDDVKGLINEVQTILQSHSQKSERLDLIEKVTNKHLDFEDMAKRSLGSTWATLNGAQRQEFVHLFSQLLKASYANHLDEFVKTKVNYEGESCDGNTSEVRITVIRPNDKIPVSFRLHQKGPGWMIYDLNIEGVSMVSNYRSQFQRAVQVISYQGLIGRLRAKLKAENLG